MSTVGAAECGHGDRGCRTRPDRGRPRGMGPARRRVRVLLRRRQNRGSPRHRLAWLTDPDHELSAIVADRGDGVVGLGSLPPVRPAPVGDDRLLPRRPLRRPGGPRPRGGHRPAARACPTRREPGMERRTGGSPRRTTIPPSRSTTGWRVEPPGSPTTCRRSPEAGPSDPEVYWARASSTLVSRGPSTGSRPVTRSITVLTQASWSRIAPRRQVGCAARACRRPHRSRPPRAPGRWPPPAAGDSSG